MSRGLLTILVALSIAGLAILLARLCARLDAANDECLRLHEEDEEDEL